ncbi:MAG: diguanylate cyclase domain-containing protein [Pseudomonadota bacterium]
MAGQKTPPPDALFRAIVDAQPESIAVIDAQGRIIYANNAWVEFGRRNDLPAPEAWSELNYLQACQAAAKRGDADGRVVVTGIRDVLDGNATAFRHEYPCHSPDKQRWFMMQATPLRWEGRVYGIISHHDITERKLAEERVEAMAYMDGLTGIPNRRYFDAFMEQEWRRASRTHTPLALVMLDIDHFKQFNDHYGHQAGDECLRRIGRTLGRFAQRAGDMAARYGGEEFAVILANTELTQAAEIAEEIRTAIQALYIPHEHSPFGQCLTASLGVAAIRPNRDEPPSHLIEAADQALYVAKAAGRNRVATAPPVCQEQTGDRRQAGPEGAA